MPKEIFYYHDNESALPVTLPTQEDVAVERRKRLVRGWKDKIAGAPPKTGKRRPWSDKEKNFMIKKWLKFNPPVGCRSNAKKIIAF